MSEVIRPGKAVGIKPSATASPVLMKRAGIIATDSNALDKQSDKR